MAEHCEKFDNVDNYNDPFVPFHVTNKMQVAFLHSTWVKEKMK